MKKCYSRKYLQKNSLLGNENTSSFGDMVSGCSRKGFSFKRIYLRIIVSSKHVKNPSHPYFSLFSHRMRTAFFFRRGVFFPTTNFTVQPKRLDLRRIPDSKESPGANGVKYKSISSKVDEFFSKNGGLTAITLENESYLHSVPSDAETHFKITVVSDHFVGKRLVQRHQVLNRLLSEELKTGVHALSIHTFTNQEWQQYLDEHVKPPVSPLCMGGSKVKLGTSETSIPQTVKAGPGSCDKPKLPQ